MVFKDSSVLRLVSCDGGWSAFARERRLVYLFVHIPLSCGNCSSVVLRLQTLCLFEALSSIASVSTSLDFALSLLVLSHVLVQSIKAIHEWFYLQFRFIGCSLCLQRGAWKLDYVLESKPGRLLYAGSSLSDCVNGEDTWVEMGYPSVKPAAWSS